MDDETVPSAFDKVSRAVTAGFAWLTASFHARAAFYWATLDFPNFALTAAVAGAIATLLILLGYRVLRKDAFRMSTLIALPLLSAVSFIPLLLFGV